MIDVKLSNGNLDLFLSNFETYDLLESKFIEIFNCTQDQVINIIINDFTIELISESDIKMSFDNSKIHDIFKWYKELMEFNEERHDVILSYLALKENSISLGKTAMYEALHYYFGTYDSDKDAVWWFLYSYLEMNKKQLYYILNVLNCVDSIIQTSFIKYNNHYFLIRHIE